MPGEHEQERNPEGNVLQHPSPTLDAERLPRLESGFESLSSGQRHLEARMDTLEAKVERQGDTLQIKLDTIIEVVSGLRVDLAGVKTSYTVTEALKQNALNYVFMTISAMIALAALIRSFFFRGVK